MRPAANQGAAGLLALLALLALGASEAWGAVALPDSSPPQDQRGRIDAEREGLHSAGNIRTLFWNFGMVGDYPADPGNVNLHDFHSVEVPKGSGMNYSDGITPFVLAKIRTVGGTDAYIMETGYRERQGISPFHNRVMRFEPRPGWFQADPRINTDRSPAISNDPNTWPDVWPDKLNDPDDPGWPGSWDGYFGKDPKRAADQESFTVMDDDFYDAWNFYPDSTDPTRRGLGLRVQVRGLQWANPQARNVIFWLYDITNEGTTDYNDNIIFGLYMDSGVGGSQLSCDGIFESDDDNAYWDRSYGSTGSRLNLVYTWDRYGHGVDLSGACGPTGYLGYAYLETPGNPFDGIDNDDDGITDEKRDGGPGTLIEGQQAIRDYVNAHYDMTKFVRAYGPLEKLPAYVHGRWWTGDEDLDWDQEFDDVGGDGVPGTHDTGESDGIPTEGEPDFDRTDVTESDQIGLTGFKLNRIRAGLGNPDPRTDGIVFYTDVNNWPYKLYTKFTNPYTPARFDSALASNYNIGFLFASGPFRLKAGQTERFSLALAYGSDLQQLRSTVSTVQQIYNLNYQFAVPPPLPVVTAEAGDGYVRLSWDDAAESGVDPATHIKDFEGYKIYRSTDPEFRDPAPITTARGSDVLLRKPMVQYDLVDGWKGYSRKTVEGVSYYLGDDSGIRHTWIDTTVTNGQEYYYSVTAYDRGFETVPYADSLALFPSENPIAAITYSPRGGQKLPTNVVRVRPNPRVPGYRAASPGTLEHTSGDGHGQVAIQVVNSNEVPEGHQMRLTFSAPADEVRATSYSLFDDTAGQGVFTTGNDLDAQGIGPVGDGLLPVISVPHQVTVDPASGFTPTSATNVHLETSYQLVLDNNLRRPGYPDSLSIVFDDRVRDTSVTTHATDRRLPAKFLVVAHTPSGDRQLDFRFIDNDNDSTLSRTDELIDIVTYADSMPNVPSTTWRVQIDSIGPGPLIKPRLGDVYQLRLDKPLGAADVFTFTTSAQHVDPALAQTQAAEQPYVVPNPYVEAASFEPAGGLGRGDRRMEFRAVPQGCTVRIYTVRGDLVQTLHQDGTNAGIVAWNLRTKDNLDVAPGLYIFQVEAPGTPTHVGKFAIIK